MRAMHVFNWRNNIEPPHIGVNTKYANYPLVGTLVFSAAVWAPRFLVRRRPVSPRAASSFWWPGRHSLTCNRAGVAVIVVTCDAMKLGVARLERLTYYPVGSQHTGNRCPAHTGLVPKHPSVFWNAHEIATCRQDNSEASRGVLFHYSQAHSSANLRFLKYPSPIPSLPPSISLWAEAARWSQQATDVRCQSCEAWGAAVKDGATVREMPKSRSFGK